MANSYQNSQQVRTLARGLTILECLKDLGPLTLTEIATELDLDKSTVLRLVNTLLDLGFVAYEDDNRKYYLGLEMILYGRRVAHDLHLRRVTLPYLERLQQASNEAVAFGVPYRDKVLWVDGLYKRNMESIPRPWWVKTSFMHSTSVGKAMLAYYPEEEVARIYREVGFPRRTENTITDLDSMRGELRQIRERGYALDNAENYDGMCCLGAPIFGSEDKVIGALSFTFSVKRFEDNYLSLIPMLQQACADISRTMGATEISLMKLTDIIR